MCVTCGFNPCNCSTVTYSYNWNTISNYPCNPCSQTDVCLKTVPAKCVIYNGPTLANLNLTAPQNVQLILSTIDIAIGAINSANALKFTNILTALNDINTRLNVLESGSHAPYVI